MAINPIPQNNINQNSLDLFKKKKPKQNDNAQNQAPYVGVVNAPEFSKTPINDTLKRKEEEVKVAPIVKKKEKMDKGIKLDILAVLGCITGIGIAIFNKVKKAKH